MKEDYDISVVLGSKNRKKLLKATIESVRKNGFSGKMQIIVIDGGSTDGTCDWLSEQRDIFTIIQPNYKIVDSEGISILAHSWGEFMNIAFKFATAPWIVMISDDLILSKGVLQKGYEEMNKRLQCGEKIGGGAFYFREYPRHSYFRVILLPGELVTINHGFYNKSALEKVNYIEEEHYNFYYADSDLIMRMNLSGYKTIALEGCFSEHLVHKPKFNKVKFPPSVIREITRFNERYPLPPPKEGLIKRYSDDKINVIPFWKSAFWNCIFGVLLRYYDKYYRA